VVTVAQWTGQEARALRWALRMTMQDFAAHLGVNVRTVAKWEARGAGIRLRAVTQAILDTALARADDHAHERLATTLNHPRPTKPDNATDETSETAAPAALKERAGLDNSTVELSDRAMQGHSDDLLSVNDPTLSFPGGKEEVSNTKEGIPGRRDVLRLGRDLGLAYLLDSAAKESVKLRGDLAAGRAAGQILTILEEEAVNLGLRIVRVPHLLLFERALAHGRIVRRLMYEPRPSGDRRRLERLVCQYALAVGEILFMEGSFKRAETWYSVARTAALESGDEDLVDLAVASSAYLPSYSDDPEGVLALVVPRLDQRRGASPGVAWLWAFRAKAEASLRMAAEHERSIERSREVLDSVAPEKVFPGIFSFTHAKLAFYETCGLVRLGRLRQATTAAEKALNLYDRTDTSERALVRLEYAIGLVDAGELEEACSFASAAVGDPRTSLCSTVSQSARDFDRSLPATRAPELHEWRETLRLYHGGEDEFS